MTGPDRRRPIIEGPAMSGPEPEPAPGPVIRDPLDHQQQQDRRSMARQEYRIPKKKSNITGNGPPARLNGKPGNMQITGQSTPERAKN